MVADEMPDHLLGGKQPLARSRRVRLHGFLVLVVLFLSVGMHGGLATEEHAAVWVVAGRVRTARRGAPIAVIALSSSEEDITLLLLRRRKQRYAGVFVVSDMIFTSDNIPRHGFIPAEVDADAGGGSRHDSLDPTNSPRWKLSFPNNSPARSSDARARRRVSDARARARRRISTSTQQGSALVLAGTAFAAGGTGIIRLVEASLSVREGQVRQCLDERSEGLGRRLRAPRVQGPRPPVRPRSTREATRVLEILTDRRGRKPVVLGCHRQVLILQSEARVSVSNVRMIAM